MSQSPKDWDFGGPADPKPEPQSFADPSYASAWITGEGLAEILSLELALARAGSTCPRCSAWVFTYGRLQFCSHGCPENQLVTEAAQ